MDRTGEGAGVERQLKDCRALAKRLSLSVSEVYTDNDTSATSGVVRPRFEAMLSARPSAIIAWHQDRLLRLTSDLEKVIALDVPVYTVTAGTLDLSTPAGRAVARTVAAWSTYETEQKATRQRSANLQRAERGEYSFSRRPFGYERREGKVVVVEPEAAVIREGYARYLAGDSYYEIAADWNRRGIRTLQAVPYKEGTLWSTARVRSMLRNDRYAGVVSYRGESVKEPAASKWQPIIDRETWEAYLRMRTRRKTPHDWSNQTKHLLSGIIACGVCAQPMLARPDRGRRVYACTTSWCVSRGADDVEAVVEGVLIARLQDPAIVAQLKMEPNTGPVEDELTELRRRRDDLAAMLAEGLLAREAVTEQARTLKGRIASLERRLEAAREASPITDLALAESVPARWAELPLPTKRNVIQSLLHVRVMKVRPGRRPFDPESVQIDWLS